MSTSATPPSPAAAPDAVAPRRPWTAPAVTALPPLERLTLQSGDISGTCTPTDGCGFSFVPSLDPWGRY